MASSPLVQLLVQGGLDPRLYGQLQNADLGGEMIRQGIDSSPTSGWGALGRLAQTLAGSYLQGSNTSDLAKTITSGREGALRDFKAAVGGSAVPTNPITAPVPEKAAEVPAGDEMARKKAAIAGIETGGEKDPYRALGPVIKNPKSAYYGDQALGKYQVMGKNLDEWGRQVFGRPISREEFLNSPELQEKMFEAKFQSPTQWFGRGSSDGYMSGDAYRSRYAQAMGQPSAVPAINQAAGIAPPAAPATAALQAPTAPIQRPQPNIAPTATPAQGVAPPVVAAAAPAEAEPKFDYGLLTSVAVDPNSPPELKTLATKILMQHFTPKEDEYASSPQGLYNKRTGLTPEGKSLSGKPAEWQRIGTDKYNQPIFGYPPSQEEFAKQKQAQAAAPPDQLADLQGPDRLAALKQSNPALAAKVQAVGEGREKYPVGSRLNRDQQELRDEVNLAYPGFNEATSKVIQDTMQDYGIKGRTGQARVAANTMLGHADDLNKLVDKLGNADYGADFYNPVHDLIMRNSSKEYQYNRGEFERLKDALLTESQKALAGHVTVSEQKALNDKINLAKSPTELHGAIRGLVHVLSSRLDAMATGFDKSMNTRTQGFEFLDPKGREIFNRFEGLNAQGSSDAGRIPGFEEGHATGKGTPAQSGGGDQPTATGPNGEKIIYDPTSHSWKPMKPLELKAGEQGT